MAYPCCVQGWTCYDHYGYSFGHSGCESQGRGCPVHHREFFKFGIAKPFLDSDEEEKWYEALEARESEIKDIIRKAEQDSRAYTPVVRPSPRQEGQ